MLRASRPAADLRQPPALRRSADVRLRAPLPGARVNDSSTEVERTEPSPASVPAYAAAASPPKPDLPRLPLLALSLVIVGLTAVGVVRTVQRHRSAEAERLEAVAALKAGQVTGWLAERRGDAQAL